jgi:sarcosine oxidase
MAKNWDVAVVGLGAMGSAALYHLASRGVRVIGFDRYAPPHTLGSTHGLSRIIREAYYEHPMYVPLVQRAYELWAELECRAGRALFVQTGGLMIGRPDGTLVAGARRSAHEHALRHEELGARELHARFPGFVVPDDMVALFEPRAGVLDPEACVASHLQLAEKAGATVQVNEPVTVWSSQPDRITLETANHRYDVERIVLCAGAWTPTLVHDAGLALWIERQVMHWFTPRTDAQLFTPAHCPIAMIEYEPDRFFYTLPDSGNGVKAAIHHEGARVDPDTVARVVSEGERARALELLRRYLPRAAGQHRSSATCLYTNTPDGHFFIAPQLPDERLLVVSACSGHGFKFASAIGEAITDLCTGRSRPDLAPFGRARPTMA